MNNWNNLKSLKLLCNAILLLSENCDFLFIFMEIDFMEMSLK